MSLIDAIVETLEAQYIDKLKLSKREFTTASMVRRFWNLRYQLCPAAC
jgi:hypothetical protein